MINIGRVKKEHWLYHKKIAHRGYHNKEAPENSMGAFENAIRKDYAIELDVRISKDNKIVVFHDKDLKRMCNVDLVVIENNYKDIKEFKLLETEEGIPLLRDLLNVVAGRVPLMIEIKNENEIGITESEVDKLLAEYKGEYVIQSFNPFSMRWFKKHNKNVIRGQISWRAKHERNLIIRFIKKHMLFNIYSKPDFINYEIEGLSSCPIKIRRLFKKPILGWTLRKKVEYDNVLKKCDNVVFEQFEL